MNSGRAYIPEFSRSDVEFIECAIKTAELDTSGEIRVHIDEVCEGDPALRAAEVFKKLNMGTTSENNAVLFYIARKNLKFFILPDKGIMQVVPQNYWGRIRQKLHNSLLKENFTESFFEVITETGSMLKKHFPYRRGDINQLSDTVSFGKV